MKIKILVLLYLLAQAVYSQESVKLQHCNCEDFISQSNPTLNGDYKRICNGKTVELVKFINDVKDGLWQSWSKKGRLIRSFSYSNGLLNGDVKFFYPNGKKKFEGSFENNLKVGIWTYYNNSGKIIKTGTYDKGKPVGIWKVFDFVTQA